MPKDNDLKLVEKLRESRDTIYYELGKQIIGQKEIIEHIIIALLCKSHALVIGVPGLAKTLLIKSISQIFDLKFSRIQFTPDLMPSDITGTEILEEDVINRNQVLQEFEEWDSLTVLSIIAMLDSNYNITMSAEDLRALETIGALEDATSSSEVEGCGSYGIKE